MTRAQARLLDKVRAAGPAGRVFNGRAAGMVRKLEAAGLVEVVWDMHPQVKGSGIELVHDILVKAKP